MREKVNFLPRKYKESKLDFDKIYRGTHSMASRAISCANMVLDNMEFAVGRLYVAKYFKSSSKKAVSHRPYLLIRQVLKSFSFLSKGYRND